MFLNIIGDLAVGFLTNLALFGLTLLMALPLGLVISFFSMTKFKPIRYLTRGFIWVIRGTPLMLQLIVVLYGPGLLGLPPMREKFLAAVIAFVINYACYFSEIYRGGIESIPVGQYEAGQVLGMSKTQVFFHVVLFQVVRRILAPMSNEVITLVKDTSLANTIAVAEIIRVAKNTTGTYAVNILIPLLYGSIFFLLFIGILSVLFNYLEKKMGYYKA
ncbi:MAG: amino acid ABC transporter permease [Ruminococcaceae bacterium]|nr:amino acid ABC transporter permease [Oscillospiraceae bacterium]